MPKLAVLFALLALVTGVLGFGAAPADMVTPARMLCFASLVVFAVCFVMALTPTAFVRASKPVPVSFDRR